MWSGASRNEAAFLDMIAIAGEWTARIGQNNGYDVIVGSTPEQPILFTDYRDHPRRKIWIPRLRIYSTAAGRYQLLAHYFDIYKALMGLADFGLDSQDQIALQQMRERGARYLINQGRFNDAVMACSSIWSSFPGSRAGQGSQPLSALRLAYLSAGGSIQA